MQSPTSPTTELSKRNALNGIISIVYSSPLTETLYAKLNYNIKRQGPQSDSLLQKAEYIIRNGPGGQRKYEKEVF